MPLTANPPVSTSAAQPARRIPRHDLIERERALLADLVRLSGERAAAEEAAEAGERLRTESIEAEFAETRSAVESRFEAEHAAAVETYESALKSANAKLESDQSAAVRACREACEAANAVADKSRETTRKSWNEARWLAATVLEAAEEGIRADRVALERRDAGWVERLRLARDAWNGTLATYRLDRFVANARADVALDEGPTDAPPIEGRLAAVEAQPARIERSKVLWFLRGSRMAWVPLAAVSLWLVVTGLVTGFNFLPWLVSALILSIVAATGAIVWLVARARRLGRAFDGEFQRQWAAADRQRRSLLAEGQARCDRELTEAHCRRDAEIADADQKYGALERETEDRRERELNQFESTKARRETELKQRRGASLLTAADSNIRRLQEIESRRGDSQQANRDGHARRVESARRKSENDRNVIAGNWRHGLGWLSASFAELIAECGALFPDWDRSADSAREASPPVMRIGRLSVRPADLPGGPPKDERLRAAAATEWPVPALLPFPSCCSLLFSAHDEGRAKAVEAIQAVMLRLLTTVPPGKVRFTILDPVGLGQSYSAFMHLADYDEALVTNRIWTEPKQIEERLTDLTSQMEVIIQRYLRNEYDSIEDYNRQAGPLAEPYRILIVTDFPAGFTDAAVDRLKSIVASGPKCGVYTIIALDPRQRPPAGFPLDELKAQSVNLVWGDGRFTWDDPDFSRFPLALDAPPSPEESTRLLHAVGERARAAARVEVPFDFIAPTPDEWWAADSRHGLSVPLGQAGATKAQRLVLGQGTSQHVLISGKTGSGKSTLLHALITNLALRYSPEEVQLYLIDFKKGVEFKAYAAHSLPHARVVAIESEREFGLSVLERLDLELKQRGELFRGMAVQDLAGYRESTGRPLPRILLIVDEFQELFIEDDKLAQDSTLLLDRLVRQGRAFGVHVLLGSQTLGGAYTLPRTTIGQMAVRIALQCSESDAHLILSEENAAARLLSRPGEAIYNDANGLVAGNKPFQVAWLADDDRDKYLQCIQEFATTVDPDSKGHNADSAEPQIVFEGNLPAALAGNHLLADLLEADAWPAPPPASHVWLGEPIAIKAPTAAVLSAQGGHNLLIVGQRAEAALGCMEAALVSLAAQHAPNRSRFYIFDGTPPDSPEAGRLEALGKALPHDVRVVGRRELATALAEIAAEVSMRQEQDSAKHPPIFLLIHGLQRFRDLRREEPDFSFSSNREESAVSPSAAFAAALREGPPLSVHSIVWCDTLSNLNRALDRQSIREFELRVLFQLSAADSSHFIDSAQASRLGPHRAFLHDEEQGRLEKFRPYGPIEDPAVLLRALESRL